jgi:hypothetical protein
MSDEKKRKQSRGARERNFRPGGEARSSKEYKKDLDKLFKSGAQVPDRFKDVMKKLEPEEGSEEAERRAAIEALRKVEGFREFAGAVVEFRKERAERDWAWPDDEDLLIRMLDHPDERVVRDALEQVAEVTRRHGFERTVALNSRLATIKTMSDDPRTRRAIDAVEEALDASAS